MAAVILTPSAQSEFDDLPMVIRTRVTSIIQRLADWPNVSGAKPLRGKLKGNWRIRTGDYRIIFRVSADQEIVTIWKIGNRGGIYDD